MYDIPATLSLETNVTVITKDLFVSCIRIVGNTVFDSFSITPELPQDLAFDMERNCLGGIYRGNSFGKQDYWIQGTNPLGTVRNVIHLYFTRTYFKMNSWIASLQKGLRSEYYEVKEKYKDTIRYLPSIPEEAISIKKISVLETMNNTSKDLTSQFYSLGVSPIEFMYSTFTGFLLISNPGFYTFRTVFESDRDEVTVR